MSRPAFFLFLFTIVISGCSAETSRDSVPVAGNSAGPSFGDVAKSIAPPRTESLTQQPSSANTMSNASTARVSNSGSAKGSRPQVSLGKSISLIQAASAQQAPVTTDRMVVRNADLQLESESATAAQQKIESIVQSYGGFVVESQQTATNRTSLNRDTVSMTVRVPAAKFITALEEIRGAGTKVIDETIRGEDVTEEFIDVEARLKNQKALELQFMEIMKRAYSVEDAIYVQGQLAEVRGEIEKIEGRKRFLENQSSLSTIKIRLQTPTAIANNSAGISSRMMQSVETGFNFSLNFMLGLATFLVAVLPFAIFIGLPVLIVFRYFWKRNDRPLSVHEIAEDELGDE
jgi:hypothetical protein